MNSILRWYTRHYTQITWFILGWLAMCLIVDFSKGDWSGCAFDLLLIFINYLLYRHDNS